MDGEGPRPIEHHYGILSEHFNGALPSEIFAEQQRLPVGFLEQLIEYRGYAAAHHANIVDEKGFDSTPMRRLAKEIQHRLAEEAKESSG